MQRAKVSYNKFFCDTSEELRRMFLEDMDINTLFSFRAFMNELYGHNPVGGAFFVKRDSYIDCGLENEAFYGWGVEDGERYIRWEVHGKTVEKVEGPLFHLTHPRGINSKMEGVDTMVIKKRSYFASIRGKQWKNDWQK